VWFPLFHPTIRSSDVCQYRTVDFRPSKWPNEPMEYRYKVHTRTSSYAVLFLPIFSNYSSRVRPRRPGGSATIPVRVSGGHPKRAILERGPPFSILPNFMACCFCRRPILSFLCCLLFRGGRERLFLFLFHTEVRHLFTFSSLISLDA
jgi:hypothetical protein